jgi:hypothetical protein
MDQPPLKDPPFGIEVKIVSDPVVHRAALAEVQQKFKIHADPHVVKAAP